MATTTEQETRPASGKRNVGRIEEIQGVVIEAVFPDKLPEINHAIIVQRPEAAAVCSSVVTDMLSPYPSPSAPATTSMISWVISAWRARFICKV